MGFSNPSLSRRTSFGRARRCHPTSAAADAEEMTDRDCHVAAAVNRQVSTRTVLRDQQTDEALVTAVDGTVAEVARHAERCWCRLCILQDRSAPVLTEEDRHDQQR